MGCQYGSREAACQLGNAIDSRGVLRRCESEDDIGGGCRESEGRRGRQSPSGDAIRATQWGRGEEHSGDGPLPPAEAYSRRRKGGGGVRPSAERTRGACGEWSEAERTLARPKGGRSGGAGTLPPERSEVHLLATYRSRTTGGRTRQQPGQG